METEVYERWKKSNKALVCRFEIKWPDGDTEFVEYLFELGRTHAGWWASVYDDETTRVMGCATYLAALTSSLGMALLEGAASSKPDDAPQVNPEPVHKCFTCKNALVTKKSETHQAEALCLLDRERKYRIIECNRFHAVDAPTRRQAKEALAEIRNIPSPAFEKITTLIDGIYNGLLERH